VEDGQVLRVAVGDDRQSSQELFVQVRVERSRHFRREGADVHSDITISLAQAALGGKIRIPGIYETLLISVSFDREVKICVVGEFERLTELQRALLLAYAETETDTKGTVEGVTSTESGLQKLREAFIGNTGSSSSSSTQRTPRTASSDEYTGDDDNNKQDSWWDRLTDGAKRLYEATRRTVGK
ncbi:Protein tumorous imaginal disc, partial [Fasciolopsis buskii]